VKNKKKHSDKLCGKQGFPTDSAEPNKIAASTHFDFEGKKSDSLRWPVSGGHDVRETGACKSWSTKTLTIKRIPRAMTIYQFVLGMVLAIYVGFRPPQSHSFLWPRIRC